MILTINWTTNSSMLTAMAISVGSGKSSTENMGRALAKCAPIIKEIQFSGASKINQSVQIILTNMIPTFLLGGKQMHLEQ